MPSWVLFRNKKRRVLKSNQSFQSTFTICEDIKELEDRFTSIRKGRELELANRNLLDNRRQEIQAENEINIFIIFAFSFVMLRLWMSVWLDFSLVLIPLHSTAKKTRSSGYIITYVMEGKALASHCRCCCRPSQKKKKKAPTASAISYPLRVQEAWSTGDRNSIDLSVRFWI